VSINSGLLPNKIQKKENIVCSLAEVNLDLWWLSDENKQIPRTRTATASTSAIRLMAGSMSTTTGTTTATTTLASPPLGNYLKSEVNALLNKEERLS